MKKPTKKNQDVTEHNLTNCNFYGSPPTNEHDVQAVAAMSNAAKELAIAIQKIADASKGRQTVMNAPMINFEGK